MNRSIRHAVSGVVLVLALGGSAAQAASFTYHGSLNDGGQPASGRYDLRLTPYGSEKAAAASAEAVTLYGVDVEDGRFSTEVDFGGVAVDGGWVAVAVRRAGGGEFADLAGRSQINGGDACWSTTGNAGTAGWPNMLGTTDNKPLVFATNGVINGSFSPVNAEGGALSLGKSWADGARSVAMGWSEAHAPDSFAGGGGGDGGGGGFVAAGHDRSFVWKGTAHGAAYRSTTGADQFLVYADGGVILNSNQLANGIDDLEIHPRQGVASDGHADLGLYSLSGKWGRLTVNDISGNMDIYSSAGVHINNPVRIDDSLEVDGPASKSTAGAWQANSDGRIKQDIQPIDSALDTLAKVHPVSFRYTDAYRAEHPQVADQRYYNVVAQQFAEVFPDAVTKSGEYLPGAEKTADNEILQVDTYPAQIVTIAAVQELAQRNATLEATVQRLTTRLAKLEAAKGK